MALKVLTLNLLKPEETLGSEVFSSLSLNCFALSVQGFNQFMFDIINNK